MQLNFNAEKSYLLQAQAISLKHSSTHEDHKQDQEPKANNEQ